MSQRVDITGKKFGRLTVLEHAGQSEGRQSMWLCRCDCGQERIVRGRNLRTGHTLSCGCHNREAVSKMLVKRNTTHGKSRSRTYRSWAKMKERCNNSQCKDYDNYGGRGITVCHRWEESFEQFLADMGECPAGMSIDRIDNDNGYSPGNCRWASKKAQNNNTRANHFLEYNGQKKTISEWAEITGINAHTIHTRLRDGWSVEKALSTPARVRIPCRAAQDQ